VVETALANGDQREAARFARLNWRNDLARRAFGPGLLSGNSICLRGEIGPHLRERGSGEGTIAAEEVVAGGASQHHFYSFAGLISIIPILHGKLAYEPVLDMPAITGTSNKFQVIGAAEGVKIGSFSGRASMLPTGKLHCAAAPDNTFDGRCQETAAQNATHTYRDFNPTKSPPRSFAASHLRKYANKPSRHGSA
jgi:hypothetical protein